MLGGSASKSPAAATAAREMRGGEVAVQVFARSPVLVEHEATGIGGVNVQVVLDAAVLRAGGFDEREQHPAQVAIFTGPRFQLGDDGQ